LLEFVLDIKVIILELFLEISVLVEQVVELIHFKVQVVFGDFKLSDFFFVVLNLAIQSKLFLLQN